jgi:hypothetical protein
VSCWAPIASFSLSTPRPRPWRSGRRAHCRQSGVSPWIGRHRRPPGAGHDVPRPGTAVAAVVEVAAARAAAVGGGAAREVEGVEKVVAVGAGRSRRRGAAAQPGVPQGCRATSGDH